MLRQFGPAVRATIVLAALTGLVFPFIVTVFGQLLFPYQANGSLVRSRQGQIVGSALIGQLFSKPEYFHPRPSAAGSGYSGEASGGTNLGPTSAKLMEGDISKTMGMDQSFAGVKQLSKNYQQENLLSAGEKVPVDAVTRSGSGLDPEISLPNALLQARRVSQARGVPVAQITNLIEKHIEGRQLGILGEPRVNVLTLNLALDEVKR